MPYLLSRMSNWATFISSACTHTYTHAQRLPTKRSQSIQMHSSAKPANSRYWTGR